MNSLSQATYFVALLKTSFVSIDEVRTQAPDALRQHLERSRALHDDGQLLMAGAFLGPIGQPVSTMAILVSRVAAQEFVDGDTFVQLGLIQETEIREWANMLRP